MFKNLYFFPEAASAQAGQVDAVFFFLVAVAFPARILMFTARVDGSRVLCLDPHESGVRTSTFRPLNRPAKGYNTRCALLGAESGLLHPNGRVKKSG